MIETHYRPTIVFTKSGDKYVASARSVHGFDIYNALEACAEHLEQFGGHMYAAGMTLQPEHYENFKNAFEEIVQKTIPPALLVPEIVIDLALDFEQITPKLIRILKQFEPFGPKNRTPVFLTQNVIDTGFGKPLGQENEHLKLFLKQKNSEGIPAIAFGLGYKIGLTSDHKQFDIVYCIDENEWNGITNLQLRIKDLNA